jgi:hypothetical protein
MVSWVNFFLSTKIPFLGSPSGKNWSQIKPLPERLDELFKTVGRSFACTHKAAIQAFKEQKYHASKCSPLNPQCRPGMCNTKHGLVAHLMGL